MTANSNTRDRSQYVEQRDHSDEALHIAQIDSPFWRCREEVTAPLAARHGPVGGDSTADANSVGSNSGLLHGIGHLSPTFGRVIYANLSTSLSAAVDDELITRNPCRARSVRSPKPVARRVVPWTPVQVAAVREALPDRYRMLAVLGAGLGLRQGEVFGLSPADLDPARGVVHVQRQVKIYDGNRLTFAPPKGGKPGTSRCPSTSSRRSPGTSLPTPRHRSCCRGTDPTDDRSRIDSSPPRGSGRP